MFVVHVLINNMLCHILIGCPSSGKSTLAREITESEPNYRIVSTDEIREKLFGDPTIQGKWSEVEAVVFQEIEAHIRKGHPVIYDATNAKRPWRMGLLEHLNQYQNIDWLGWHLQTPLKTCLKWNQQRERKVPEAVIKRMFESLKQFPPIAAEGFATVYPLNPKTKLSFFDQFWQKLSNFSRTLINRQNRTQNITRHNYSQLLDFERLMYLISLLLNYPGVGNLQKTDPETVKEVIGKRRKSFETGIEEICAFMSQIADPIYADPEAIKNDLQWLEENGLIGYADIPSDLKLNSQENSDLVTHTYSDIEPFSRIIKMIRLITHEPFIWKPELGGTLDSLVRRMEEEEILEPNRGNSLRKDIEKVLKPYGLLPEFPMKRGYFAGTAVLSQKDLVKVFHLLESQVKRLDDPIGLQVYETFKKRMETAKLTQSNYYPVRGIHNRNIISLEMVSDSSLAVNTEEVETAIEEGRLIELGRLKGGARFEFNEKERFFKVYPLQLVFHNIGWYLGFEYYEGENKGLLRFERLDRLFLGQPQGKTRSRNAQLKALNRLISLYNCCGGIFLGNDPKQQQQYLDDGERKQVEVLIELWCSDLIFPFISEGTKRFPLKQMKMSQPRDRDLFRKNRSLFSLRKTSDPKFPHRFRVYLPAWSLEDFDFHRWILGFGGEVKVASPEELRETLQRKGKAIAIAMSND